LGGRDEPAINKQYATGALRAASTHTHISLIYWGVVRAGGKTNCTGRIIAPYKKHACNFTETGRTHLGEHKVGAWADSGHPDIPAHCKQRLYRLDNMTSDRSTELQNPHKRGRFIVIYDATKMCASKVAISQISCMHIFMCDKATKQLGGTEGTNETCQFCRQLNSCLPCFSQV
jgi:hypothetical protein